MNSSRVPRTQSALKPIIPALQNSPNLTPRAQQKTNPILSNTLNSQRRTKPLYPTKVIDHNYGLKTTLKKLNELLRDLMIKNKATIFIELQIQQQFKELERYIKPLYSEIEKFFGLVDSVTNPEEYKRISTTTAKQTAMFFIKKWKEFNGLLTLIKQNGNKSNVDYVMLKFYKIEGIIVEITRNHKKTNAKTKELENAGGSLIELLRSLQDGVKMLLLDPALMKKEPNMRDVRINDLKQYVRVYNATAFELFQYSGFMPCELGQFRTTFQSTVNDIINGIKCSFSFEDDMNHVMDAADNFNSALMTAFDEIKLPDVVIHETEKVKVPEIVAREIETTVEDQIVNFVENNDFYMQMTDGNRTSALKEDIVMAAKVDYFVDTIANKMGITIEPNENVWERLNGLYESFNKRINSVKEVENELETTKEKIHSQSATIQQMILDKQKMEMVFQKEKDDLNAKISKLEDEISNQKATINSNVQQITHLREVIADMRDQLDHKRRNDVVEGVGEKMQEMMTTLDQSKNNPLLPADEELQKKDKMNLFVLEKRCTRCREYELMTRRVKQKLREIVEIPKNAPLPQVIDSFIEDYKTLLANYKQLQNDHEKLQADYELLIKTNQQILDTIADGLQEINVEYTHKTADEMARAMIDGFNKLKNHYEKAMKEKEEQIRKENTEKLDEILKLLRTLVPDEEGDDNLAPIELFMKKFKQLDERIKKLEHDRIYHVNTLKSVEKWMNDKTGFITEGMPFDQSLSLMMKAIDEAPNPLQEEYDNLVAEKKVARMEILAIYQNLRKERQVDKEIDTENCPYTELINALHMLVDQITDEAHAREFIITQQRGEIDNVVNKLRKAVQDFANILHHDEIKTEQMELALLLQNLDMLVDELCTPGGNKHFIAVSVVNQLTFEVRHLPNIVDEDQQLAPDPGKYLPTICEQFVKQYKTIQAVEKIKHPLEVLYRRFDFNYDSFDPRLADFEQMRNEIFLLHQTVYDAFHIDGILQTVQFVVQRLLALASIFLSATVALKLDTQGVKHPEEGFQSSMEQIRTSLLHF